LINNYKKDGYFLEIGSSEPKYTNNTYALEKYLNWKGFLVEHSSYYYPHYLVQRPNSIPIINDASQIDYLKYLQDYNFPNTIDYLQIDLDVNNRSTLNTLELLDKNVFDKYTFSTITFEHDIYTGNYFDTQKISREILQKRNYILLFQNVTIWYNNMLCQFEDWYISKEILDQNKVKQILEDPENISGVMSDVCIKILKKYLI
jgi:hypothetical protein